MPIYEYECKQCGHRFEQLQKITDAPLQICPNCTQSSLTKLVSNTSFQLKGGGWYVTDFKNPKPEKTTAQKEGAATNVATKKESQPTSTETKAKDKDSGTSKTTT